MPYTIDNPPDRIKDLPKHAQEIWIKAFNAAFRQYEGNENIAYSVAWAAVQKAGYKQDSDGRWVKVESETVRISEFCELCSEQIDIKTDEVYLKKLTEDDPNPFFVTAKALKAGVSKNKRRYTNEILNKVKQQLPVYGYLGHIKEDETGYKYRDPVTLWFAGEIIGDWLYVKGYVPATEERLRQKISLSLRANKPIPVSILGEFVTRRNRDIWDVLDIRLVSIDWAPSELEGVPGAHVLNISKEQKEASMSTKEEVLASLTIDDLRNSRPDLITALKSEMVESDEAKKKSQEFQEKIKSLEAENIKLKNEIINTHRTKLLAEIKDEKVRDIAQDLLTGETIEELDKNWQQVKTKIANLERPGMVLISGESKSKKGEDFLKTPYIPD